MWRSSQNVENSQIFKSEWVHYQRDDLHMFREKKDKTILHKISSFVAVNEKSSKIYLLLFTSQIL